MNELQEAIDKWESLKFDRSWMQPLVKTMQPMVDAAKRWNDLQEFLDTPIEGLES